MVENVITLNVNPVLFIVIPAVLLVVYLRILGFSIFRQER